MQLIGKTYIWDENIDLEYNDDSDNEVFYTVMSNNIGQVLEKNAKVEIARLEKQTGKKWRADYSKYLYVQDETDPNMNNPCKRTDGYVWIVTDMVY